jgi:catechol 2,3-dioxygenase-like lactoylglutathione lyase family enzyme
MLGSARLQTLVLTADKVKAKRFYSDVLGLAFVGESLGALVYRVGESDLRVSAVPETRPSEHTVAGFAVGDLSEIAEGLARHDVPLERFSGFAHDASGVWTAPDGTKVIWFRDFDGNLLSAVQYQDRA